MLNLEIKTEPLSLEEILKHCEMILNHVVKTGDFKVITKLIMIIHFIFRKVTLAFLINCHKV